MIHDRPLFLYTCLLLGDMDYDSTYDAIPLMMCGHTVNASVKHREQRVPFPALGPVHHRYWQQLPLLLLARFVPRAVTLHFGAHS
jgi:hypothetical protein